MEEGAETERMEAGGWAKEGHSAAEGLERKSVIRKEQTDTLEFELRHDIKVNNENEDFRGGKGNNQLYQHLVDID